MPTEQPKYQRLYEELAAQIHSHKLKPGDRLPSEPLLAEEFGVAYMTVRKAVSAMVEAGLLYRVRGRGTFVADQDPLDDRPALGLLLIQNWHSVDPFYFPPLVTGFVSRAEDLGFQVHLAARSETAAEIRKFHDLHVRAAACVLLELDDLLDADALLNQGIMVVAINHYGGSRRISSVSPDNRSASYEATMRLIDLGHEKLAYLAGPPSNFDASERLAGFLDAVRDVGISDSLVKVIQSGFTEVDGYESGRRVLEADDLPTGIMAASDLTAIGLLKALAHQGVRVPEDVSVFGFGDFRLAAYVEPALTTVQLPLEEIGRRAADALAAQYKGVRHDSVSVSCPVIWRDSVGVPRPAEKAR